MREAFAITGKIVTGTATETDRRRLEHLVRGSIQVSEEAHRIHGKIP